MEQNAVYAPNPGFVMRQIAGEVLLVPVGEQTRIFNGMITFSETGGFIWKQLDGERTVAEVARLLADACNEDVTAILPDVEEFLTRAAQKGFIVKK